PWVPSCRRLPSDFWLIGVGSFAAVAPAVHQQRAWGSRLRRTRLVGLAGALLVGLGRLSTAELWARRFDGRSPSGRCNSTMAGRRAAFVNGGSIMGKIVRRVLDGYVTLIEWSPSDPKLVEAAEMVFRREVERGYMAVVDKDR